LIIDSYLSRLEGWLRCKSTSDFAPNALALWVDLPLKPQLALLGPLYRMNSRKVRRVDSNVSSNLRLGYRRIPASRFCFSRPVASAFSSGLPKRANRRPWLRFGRQQTMALLPTVIEVGLFSHDVGDPCPTPRCRGCGPIETYLLDRYVLTVLPTMVNPQFNSTTLDRSTLCSHTGQFTGTHIQAAPINVFLVPVTRLVYL
jgi:hypothetical protein